MPQQERYFITAIGTDSGKTLVSSILVEALKADYWKPIQAGEPRDIDTVKNLISNTNTVFHKSSYDLQMPASPHMAAPAEGIAIEMDKIILPSTQNHLVIEGAGGILVPLNENDVVIDLVRKLNAEVVLVANLYLGSINHTLLTVNELKRRNIAVKGIIFNGEPNVASQEIILQKSGYRELLHILPEKEITKEVVLKYAENIKL